MSNVQVSVTVEGSLIVMYMDAGLSQNSSSSLKRTPFIGEGAGCSSQDCMSTDTVHVDACELRCPA